MEELPPGVTQVLLLRLGAVVAAGPIDEVLTAAPLSRCFGPPLAVDLLAARRYAVRWLRRGGWSPSLSAPSSVAPSGAGVDASEGCTGRGHVTIGI